MIMTALEKLNRWDDVPPDQLWGKFRDELVAGVETAAGKTLAATVQPRRVLDDTPDSRRVLAA